MTFERVETARSGAAWDIMSKFGEVLAKAEKAVAAKLQDPAMRKMAAARVSLEYAVIATARERALGTEVVAGALSGATVAQQAMLIKEGRAALGRAFGTEPDLLVGALAGKMVEVEMPRGMGTNPAMDKMIDAARNLVVGVVRDEYSSRGSFNVGASHRDSSMSLKSEAVTAPLKAELATRLAFIESSVDAAVAKGVMTETNGQMLKERIEAQVFQPRPPQSMEFSKQFMDYFTSRGQAMRAEVMKDVRTVTQSQTVQDIAKKLSIAMPVQKPSALGVTQRETKPLER